MTKHILITGGAGFIGANFISFLLSENENVHLVNLDLMTYAGDPENMVEFEIGFALHNAGEAPPMHRRCGGPWC